ncbi:MAG: DUF4214 domain-containing protein [Actinomycetota bacterium]
MATLVTRQVESAPFPEVAVMVDHESHQPDAAAPPPDQSSPAEIPRPSRSMLASLTLVTIVAIVAGLLGPSPASGHDEEDAVEGDAVAVDAPDIVFPVVGPSSFVDTWGACRGPNCSRSHEGVDIFAIKLAPMVAVEDGEITSIRRSGLGLGGNLIALTGDSGWRYLYIHVNNDSPGTDDGANPQAWITANRLRVGDRVSAGDVLGYLGDSGNAEETPPHVHFEIHQPGVGAINPTDIVAEARDAGRVVSVASLASTPEGRATHATTVDAWYRALLDREPTAEELFAWTDRMAIDFANENDLIADLTMAKPRRDLAGDVVRGFTVTLGRRPSLNEIRQWEQALEGDTDLIEMSQVLVDSGPFQDRFGQLSDEAFVDAMFRSAIGRAPSETELADWLALFEDGAGRGDLAAHLADSYEVKNDTWRSLEVIQAFRAGLDRMPTDGEFDRWLGHLDGGGLIPDVVEAIRSGDVDDAAADDEPAGDTEEPAEADEPASDTDEPATDDEPAGDTNEPAEADEPAGDTDEPATDDEPAGDTDEPAEADEPAGDTDEPAPDADQVDEQPAPAQAPADTEESIAGAEASTGSLQAGEETEATAAEEAAPADTD